MDEHDLIEFIRQQGIEAELVLLETKTPTVAAAADAVGVAPDQIGKSILFLADSQPVLVVANGATRLGYKPLADYLGISRRRLKLANASQVLLTTGYPVGTVPPFGHKNRIRTILEAQVMTEEELFTGGGSIQALLRIKVKELARVTTTEIASLQA
ncbi:MAG TPA: YbaK/EbsC family protein [Patescibacteria group bacterium]|jgi:prolyl-tRNA editing enzyme YbaK/EbsC (Cys-tRNA(Pro) deacylase)|nr:YbaK/EbsC family protein [Patescibacteria group bacterium]